MTLLFAIVTLTGCSKPYNPDALSGSWKMRDLVPFPGEEFSEKTTFFKNDSVLTEMFVDGKRIEHYSGTYKLDRIGRKLSVSIIMPESSAVFESEIIKLTDEELILVKEKKEIVFIRP